MVQRALIATLIITLHGCGGGKRPDYISTTFALAYFWLGGHFAAADIEAVELAAMARGLCAEPPRVGWVGVHPAAFERFGCARDCHGYHAGYIEVVGEPACCAGESALLHEFFHACDGDDAHRDARWALAGVAVACENSSR